MRPDQRENDENLLNHIVLPRVLPDERGQNKFRDSNLLFHLNEAIDNLSSWIPSTTVHLFNSLIRTHENLTPETITGEINALQPGQTFTMFVQRQNTGFMIHMPYEQAKESKTVIVSTFPSSLHPKQIYEHLGDLEV